MRFSAGIPRGHENRARPVWARFLRCTTRGYRAPSPRKPVPLASSPRPEAVHLRLKTEFNHRGFFWVAGCIANTSFVICIDSGHVGFAPAPSRACGDPSAKRLVGTHLPGGHPDRQTSRYKRHPSAAVCRPLRACQGPGCALRQRRCACHLRRRVTHPKGNVIDANSGATINPRAKSTVIICACTCAPTLQSPMPPTRPHSGRRFSPTRFIRRV